MLMQLKMQHHFPHLYLVIGVPNPQPHPPTNVPSRVVPSPPPVLLGRNCYLVFGDLHVTDLHRFIMATVSDWGSVVMTN